MWLTADKATATILHAGKLYLGPFVTNSCWFAFFRICELFSGAMRKKLPPPKKGVMYVDLIYMKCKAVREAPRTKRIYHLHFSEYDEKILTYIMYIRWATWEGKEYKKNKSCHSKSTFFKQIWSNTPTMSLSNATLPDYILFLGISAF